MAKAPENGRKGVDRFTNNGYGLKVKPAITKKQAAAIDADAKKSNQGKKK